MASIISISMTRSSWKVSSIFCWFLNIKSTLFTDKSTLSLPNLLLASLASSKAVGFEALKITCKQPAYKSFRTSSIRLILPPAHTFISMFLLMFSIVCTFFSCSSSSVDISKIMILSIPLSLYIWQSSYTSPITV